jgi:hypothetical protein
MIESFKQLSHGMKRLARYNRRGISELRRAAKELLAEWQAECEATGKQKAEELVKQRQANGKRT